MLRVKLMQRKSFKILYADSPNHNFFQHLCTMFHTAFEKARLCSRLDIFFRFKKFSRMKVNLFSIIAKLLDFLPCKLAIRAYERLQDTNRLYVRPSKLRPLDDTQILNVLRHKHNVFHYSRVLARKLAYSALVSFMRVKKSAKLNFRRSL